MPNFAMFPEEFVREQLERYTRRGDVIFDCFSGRGTTLLESLLLNRQAAAIDINPVAFCVSGAKAEIPDYAALHERLDDLEYVYKRTKSAVLEDERKRLPEFFGRAFRADTLRQILFLRRALLWRYRRTDRFIAALALGSLHGEMDRSQSYFSNQMPRTISTKPDYSLSYWRQHELWPRKRDVFELLRRRAELRYSGTHPQMDGAVALGDARKSATLFRDLHGAVDAVITSPPYYDVTNFEEDQWLRLWFLGNNPRPTYSRVSKDDRYRQLDVSLYWSFLAEVWAGIKPLMRESGVIICRLGVKGMPQSLLTRRLRESIQVAFPKAYLIADPVQSRLRNRQRDRFQPGTEGCLFEVDYAFAVGT